MTDLHVSETASSIAPGWHTDPADSANVRWWDGSAWTAHVAPKPQVVPVPPGPDQAAVVQPAPQQAMNPEQAQLQREAAYVPFQGGMGGEPYTMDMQPQQRWSGSANTVAVWLLVFSWVWVSAVSALGRLLLLAVSPQAANFAGIVLAVVVLIGLGYADRSALRKRGFTKTPTPWTMLIFGPLLYMIFRLAYVGRKSLPPFITYMSFVLVTIVLIVVAVLALTTNPGLLSSFSRT
jgi:hypothetical protein